MSTETSDMDRDQQRRRNPRAVAYYDTVARDVRQIHGDLHKANFHRRPVIPSLTV